VHTPFHFTCISHLIIFITFHYIVPVCLLHSVQHLYTDIPYIYFSFSKHQLHPFPAAPTTKLTLLPMHLINTNSAHNLTLMATMSFTRLGRPMIISHIIHSICCRICIAFFSSIYIFFFTWHMQVHLPLAYTYILYLQYPSYLVHVLPLSIGACIFTLVGARVPFH
jgi:hypothetical protein